MGSRVMCEGSPYNKSLECDLESVERWASEYVEDLFSGTQ